MKRVLHLELDSCLHCPYACVKLKDEYQLEGDDNVEYQYCGLDEKIQSSNVEMADKIMFAQCILQILD